MSDPSARRSDRSCSVCGAAGPSCPYLGAECFGAWSEARRRSVPVVAAVLMREGRVLLCRRPEHKRHGGLWEFPGGKLHDGETLGEAARRELDEELALALTRLGRHLERRSDPGSAFVIPFVEVDAEGEPQPLEHAELAWVEPHVLLSYPLAPGDRAFAEAWTAARDGRDALS